MASETPAPKPAATPVPTPKPAAVKPATAPVRVTVAAPAAKPAAPPAVPVPPVASAAPKPVSPPKVAAPSKAVPAVPVATVAPAAAKPAPPKPAAAKPAAPAVTVPVASGPAATFELPAAVYSPQLLESVTYDIQYYLDWYRQNQIRKQVGASPKDEPNHSDETVLVIEAWFAGQAPTLESLEALLHHLRHLELPEAHIMLAALPNRTQRQTLVNWLRSNTTPRLLVSFVADRNLGGGIVVRTPNHVYDYSWKQELIAGREKLAGILKRV